MIATTVQQAGRELAARPGDAGTSRQQVSALVPFVLGVTGHRDLRPEDLRALRERVGEIFHTLRRDDPHTPLVLLSPLSEGADRFVAEVALEQGVQLPAVLPRRRASATSGCIAAARGASSRGLSIKRSR